jgi:hypothetical protein
MQGTDIVPGTKSIETLQKMLDTFIGYTQEKLSIFD